MATKKAPKTKAPAKKAAPKKAPAKKAAPKKAPAKKAEAPKKAAAAKKPAVALKIGALSVGQAAPAFSLPADDGSTISLADLKGQNVVIYFYPRDMTPGCTVEACGFRDSQAALRKLGAVVLGVSKDSVKTHQKFKVKEKLNFPLLSDETGEMIAAYGSWGPKTFMGRKFDGILRTTVLIDKNGKIAKLWPKVDVKVHAAHVLDDLAALG